MIIIVDTLQRVYDPELNRWINGETETWRFNFNGKKLYSQNNTWSVPCNSVDEALNKVKGYFYGSNYVIIDLKPGI